MSEYKVAVEVAGRSGMIEYSQTIYGKLDDEAKRLSQDGVWDDNNVFYPGHSIISVHYGHWGVE